MKKRMKDLTSGVANLAMNDDLEKTEAERIDLFHDFVKKLVDESKDEVGFLSVYETEVYSVILLLSQLAKLIFGPIY